MDAAPEPPIMMRGTLLGGWVFIPASVGSVDERAYLERGGKRVPLLHCSVELEEFAGSMAGIEAGFTHHYDEHSVHDGSEAPYRRTPGVSPR